MSSKLIFIFICVISTVTGENKLCHVVDDEVNADDAAPLPPPPDIVVDRTKTQPSVDTAVDSNNKQSSVDIAKLQINPVDKPSSIIQGESVLDSDRQKRYKAIWNIDETKNTIRITVQISDAKNVGWFGFGLSDQGSMIGADIVIYSFDANGTVQISDRHATAYAVPIVDEIQDYSLVSSERNDGSPLMATISRKLSTGDSNDYELKPHQEVVMLYALYESDPPVMWSNGPKHTYRGFMKVNLTNTAV